MEWSGVDDETEWTTILFVGIVWVCLGDVVCCGERQGAAC